MPSTFRTFGFAAVAALLWLGPTLRAASQNTDTFGGCMVSDWTPKGLCKG